MSKISIDLIKQLRERSGAPVAAVRKALEATDGDIEKAVIELRKRGAVMAGEKSARSAKEGFIGSYIHSNGKIAAFVELSSETDFVARNPEFQALANDLAMQVAAMNPMAVLPEDVDASAIARETEIAEAQLKEQGKPEAMIPKIIEGKLKKFRDEHALMTQPFVKNDEMTIADLLHDKIAVLGENIKVNRFVRLELGK